VTNLKETRKRLWIAFAAMGGVVAIALGLLFSPWVGSAKTRNEEQQRLRVEWRKKQELVRQVGDINEKIAQAGQEIDTFYKDRLPGRDSAISESLGKLATDSGVKLEQVKYDAQDPDAVGLQPVLIEASLSGPYPQLARFLNSLERNQLFFIVDGVDLGGQQDNEVKLDMKLRTFVRAGS
jgi:Tfp pilus assembly protein PilO